MEEYVASEKSIRNTKGGMYIATEGVTVLKVNCHQSCKGGKDEN
jgi:hypothetical protein